MAKTKKPFSYWARLEELDLTEEELCELAGVSMRTLHKFKNGKCGVVGIHTLIMLRKHLGCSYEELLVAFY